MAGGDHDGLAAESVLAGYAGPPWRMPERPQAECNAQAVDWCTSGR